MIKSVCLNSGYAAETEYAPLLVHNVNGFETIQEFIEAFTRLFDICDAGNVSWDTPEEGYRKLQSSVYDDFGYEFDERISEKGWRLSDPNLGPWIMVYNGYNAIESGSAYYVFYPDGKEEFIRKE